MAPAKPQEILRASVLDRLSSGHRTRNPDGEIGLREVHAAVRRDLERLLNSRVWWPNGLGEFEEASTSLLAYGIPDLTAFSWASSNDNRAVVKVIEEAIKRFEPRLLPRSVKVTKLEREGIDDFRVRVRIDAILQVEPYTERVSFDSEFDPDTGGIRLAGSL